MPSETADRDAQLPDIVLLNAFSAVDVTGRRHEVARVDIEACSHCCDLRVHLVNSVEDPFRLANDAVFLASVQAQLRNVGYDGPAFGRAELGLQDDSCIVLESSVAFQRFAMTRGWQYADGNEEHAINELLREATPWSAVMSFRVSNGAVFGIPVERVARHHAAAHLSEHEGSTLKTLTEHTLPLFAHHPRFITQWLRERMRWADVKESVRQLGAAPELDLAAEYSAVTSKSVRGMPKQTLSSRR